MRVYFSREREQRNANGSIHLWCLTSDDGTRIMTKYIPVEVRNALRTHKRYHRWKVQQYHDQLVERQFGTLFLKRLAYLCEHVETVQFRGNYPGWWGGRCGLN